MDGLDSKEWKSVVLPKIYEEKMQKLEAELEKKVRTLMALVQAFWNCYTELGDGGVGRCAVSYREGVV